MERPQEWHFLFDRDCHVVFHSVKCSEDKVENAHRVSQLNGQLLYDNCKTAPSIAEVVTALHLIRVNKRAKPKSAGGQQQTSAP